MGDRPVGRSGSGDDDGGPDQRAFGRGTAADLHPDTRRQGGSGPFVLSSGPKMASRAHPFRCRRARIALVDPETLSQLLSPTGWALLGALPPYDDKKALALSERLHREGLDPRLVAGALTQSRLRARARAKFADFADGMLFTAAGLEQATRLSVGARHAAGVPGT